MFIDIHTHIFPDAVAPKAVAKLAGIISQVPTMDGTYDGLRRSQENAGVDISVVLPVVTAPHQFDSVLRFADQVNEKFYQNNRKGIMSLAGIHPDSENYAEKLRLIKAHGFAGIKLHPDYQGYMFRDIRYKRILDKSSELGLITVVHTGWDPVSPDKIHCDVPDILDVIRDVAPEKLVLAHMGGSKGYEEVEKNILGEKVYLDTAYSIENMEPDRLLRMIRKHGADKVLFGSDVPWSGQKEDVEILKNLGLTEDELEQVSHKNARKLLNL